MLGEGLRGFPPLENEALSAWLGGMVVVPTVPERAGVPGQTQAVRCRPSPSEDSDYRPLPPALRRRVYLPHAELPFLFLANSAKESWELH